MDALCMVVRILSSKVVPEMEQLRLSILAPRGIYEKCDAAARAG